MSIAGALVPIRLDSSRLPAKALQDISGLPAVQRLLTQIEACGCVERQHIIVCTTERGADDALVDIAGRLGVGVYRGSTDDLVDRLYRAMCAHRLEWVLQVDGDDICADPDYMAACLERVRSGADVACCEPGLPLGAASKAFRSECLRVIHDAYVPGRNDTGFGYYLTRSGLFTIERVAPLEPAHTMPDLRLTLDYPEDLELFRALFGELRGARDAAVRLAEICALVRTRPELKRLNAALDPDYWRRTRELIAQHPLRLRRGSETVQLDIE
jgi:spore coat polysaccharide biosynthesis protein SpsF